MLRSAYCALADAGGDAELAQLGECPFDQGGYFVVNGSEKVGRRVGGGSNPGPCPNPDPNPDPDPTPLLSPLFQVLIAQERMANNHCYVFKKPTPKHAWSAECRSAPEGAVKAQSAVAVRQLARAGAGGGQTLCVSLPYTKADVPVVVAFRALGLTSDRDVIEHIVHDPADAEMLDALRPSIEEAFPVQAQETALDYIGKRAGAAGAARAERIAFARDILHKELLPHVGVGPAADTRKAYYLGCVEERREERAGPRARPPRAPPLARSHPPTRPLSLFPLQLHGAPPAPRRPRPRPPRRPRPLLAQAARPRRPLAGFPLSPALSQAHQGRARARAAVVGQRAGAQPGGGDFEGHDHAGAAVCRRHRQLGRPGRGRRARRRLPSPQPPDVRVHALPPAPHQLPHRARGQAGQAAPAAQLAVGHGVPGGDARGAGVRARQKPGPDGLHLRRVPPSPRARFSRRMDHGAPGGGDGGRAAGRHQSLPQRRVGRRAPRRARPRVHPARHAAPGGHQHRGRHRARRRAAGVAAVFGCRAVLPPALHRGGRRRALAQGACGLPGAPGGRRGGPVRLARARVRKEEEGRGGREAGEGGAPRPRPTPPSLLHSPLSATAALSSTSTPRRRRQP